MLIYYNEVSLYIKHMIQETDGADPMNTRWHAANKTNKKYGQEYLLQSRSTSMYNR